MTAKKIKHIKSCAFIRSLHGCQTIHAQSRAAERQEEFWKTCPSVILLLYEHHRTHSHKPGWDSPLRTWAVWFTTFVRALRHEQRHPYAIFTLIWASDLFSVKSGVGILWEPVKLYWRQSFECFSWNYYLLICYEVIWNKNLIRQENFIFAFPGTPLLSERTLLSRATEGRTSTVKIKSGLLFKDRPTSSNCSPVLRSHGSQARAMRWAGRGHAAEMCGYLFVYDIRERALGWTLVKRVQVSAMTKQLT